jgi:endonuclease YncB( thermonuclease family)
MLRRAMGKNKAPGLGGMHQSGTILQNGKSVMKLLPILFAGLGFLIAGPVAAQDAVTGNARVLTADRLIVDDTQFFLFGIDGFEEAQTCFINGEPWACGAVAFRELQILADVGPVTCVRQQDRNPRRMRFPWGTCMAGGVDLAEAMVRAGFAFVVMDQSEQYLPAQAAAEAEGVGAWQGIFIAPWEYRDRLRGL